MEVVQQYPNVYKRGRKGEVRVWAMELGQDVDVWGHRTVSGIMDGKLVTSGWTTCVAKNVGRANETSVHAQAEAEIAAAYEKKLELTYHKDIDSIDNERYVEPMLAHNYGNHASVFALTSSGIVWAQPKLDGIRCIARADGLSTRKGKKIVACPHIEAALAPYFLRNPDAVFDGELYNHYFADDFNKITSIVRKAKPTKADLARSEQFMMFHIYDWVSERDFGLRMKGVSEVVAQINHPSVLAVATVRVTSQDVLDKLYAFWMIEGYEGQMVRPDDGTGYQPGKRSHSLLKRKEFQTEEFEVIRMEEGNGNWAGAVKKFVVKMPDGTEGDATPKGTYESLKKLKEDGKCPKWITARFFGYTPDGKMRFPVAVDWGFSAKRPD